MSDSNVEKTAVAAPAERKRNSIKLDELKALFTLPQAERIAAMQALGINAEVVPAVAPEYPQVVTHEKYGVGIKFGEGRFDTTWHGVSNWPSALSRAALLVKYQADILACCEEAARRGLVKAAAKRDPAGTEQSTPRPFRVLSQR